MAESPKCTLLGSGVSLLVPRQARPTYHRARARESFTVTPCAHTSVFLFRPPLLLPIPLSSLPALCLFSTSSYLFLRLATYFLTGTVVCPPRRCWSTLPAPESAKPAACHYSRVLPSRRGIGIATFPSRDHRLFPRDPLVFSFRERVAVRDR